MVSVLPASYPSDRHGTSHVQVYIHACGRLEALSVEEPPSASNVRAAARRAFDLPAGQEMLLQDQEGRELKDEAALIDVISHAETVYACLPSSALHDFERRIDQLQHMEVGYLCDQLVSFRHDYTELRSELASLRGAVDQEQAARQSNHESTRRTIDVLRREVEASLREHRELRPQRPFDEGHLERLQVLELSVLEVRQGLQDEVSGRTLTAELLEARRNNEELRKEMRSHGQALELTERRLESDVDRWRLALQTEIKSREEREASLEQMLSDTRKALDEVASSSRDAVARVSMQDAAIEASFEHAITDTKKAIDEVAKSSREAVARLALRLEAQEASRQSDASVQTEGVATELRKEQNEEVTSLVSRCTAQEAALEAERLARQQVATDFTQQLSLAVESIQEEQVLRSSENGELRRSIEGFCRSLEEVRERQDAVERQVTRSAYDLSKGFDDEVHSQGLEIAKLNRLLLEEREERQKGESQASQRIEAALAAVKADACLQSTSLEELSEKISQVRAKLTEQHLPQATAWVREVRELVDSERSARTSEMKSLSARLDECATHEQEVSAHVSSALTQCLHNISGEQQARSKLDSEVRSWLDHEAKLREEGHMALSNSVQKAVSALEEALRRREAIDAELKDVKESANSSPAASSQVSQLQEGLARIVEALQQERRTRSESDNQLRSDCQEALQKEIRARLEGVAKTREDIETRAQMCDEAIQRQISARLEGESKICEAIQKETSSRLDMEAKLREELRIEARTREEGLRATDLAIAECNVGIAECKRGLETHTHELRLAPEEPALVRQEPVASLFPSASLPEPPSRSFGAGCAPQASLMGPSAGADMTGLIPGWAPEGPAPAKGPPRQPIHSA